MPTDPQIDLDRALVASVLAGLGPEVKRLLVQVDRQVRSLVRRNFPSAHREDLIHDFSQALWEDEWRRLRLWRGDSPLSHYLATLFSNFQLDRLGALNRERLNESRFSETQQALNANEDGERPDTAQEVQELRDCLESGVAQITPRQQQILSLRHGAGFDYRAIGEALGVTTGTVGSNLADAEKALRRRMQGECAELLEEILGTARQGH
jgi:RNA polymerase sigma factor (sigma-70 family)